MGYDRVALTQSTELAGAGERTYNDLVTVASDPAIADPAYNTVKTYANAQNVSADYGDGSDAHVASQAIEAMGCQSWRVVMADTETYNHQDGNDESTNNTTVPNSPVHTIVTISVDGSTIQENDIAYTTQSPPSAPDSGAVVQMDTGEVVVAEATAGDGTSGGIQIEYERLTWTETFSALDGLGVDLAFLADTRMTERHIGDFDELLTWGSENDVALNAAIDARPYSDDREAMDAAHRISKYHASNNVMFYAVKTDGDAAAAQLGHIATQYPWYDPDFDSDVAYPMSFDSIRLGIVGGPNQTGTFEGGDQNGEGNVNVIMPSPRGGSPVLSESLTPLGPSSSYQWWDVFRSESYIASVIDLGLTNLARNRQKIPFNRDGRTIIIEALRDFFRPLVSPGGIYVARRQSSESEPLLGRSAEEKSSDSGSSSGSSTTEQSSQRQQTEELSPARLGPQRGTPGSIDQSRPLAELEIDIPFPENFTDAAKSARRFDPVNIRGRFAGNAHYFGVEFTLEV